MSLERFVSAVEAALAAENWYAALALALALPDLCARLENPDIPTSQRYPDWWGRYMQHHYRARVGADRREITFLTPGDAYALRCAMLHEGRVEIAEQRARVALTRFHFIMPMGTNYIHCNRSNDALQLQVDVYCGQICDAVRRWEQDVRSDEAIQERAAELLDIIDVAQHGLRF